MYKNSILKTKLLSEHLLPEQQQQHKEHFLLLLKCKFQLIKILFVARTVALILNFITLLSDDLIMILLDKSRVLEISEK